MEKTVNSNYLKGITNIFLIVCALFMVLNFLKGIWDWSFYFGDGRWSSLMRFMNYIGKFHLMIYVLIYVLEIVFLLILNHFVKKQLAGKGYHVLLVLVSFLPVLNCFLFYIIKRKLNKQLFAYSGMNGVNSDRKIVATWILMLLFIAYTFLIPLLTFYVIAPELVSMAAYYSQISIVVTDCYFLTTSLIWLLYYLEFKRILHKVERDKSGIGDAQLLDN